MRDKVCISFLQHYLPRLGYRWKDLIRVENCVYKRREMNESQVGNFLKSPK